jgi:hypothetical protein
MRLAFESEEIISHHSASLRSLENVMIVPWKFSRERRMVSASWRRASARGTPFTRSRMPSQSITADVGQRLGSMLMDSSMPASAAP